MDLHSEKTRPRTLACSVDLTWKPYAMYKNEITNKIRPDAPYLGLGRILFRECLHGRVTGAARNAEYLDEGAVTMQGRRRRSRVFMQVRQPTRYDYNAVRKTDPVILKQHVLNMIQRLV